jgi:hypothetical protein
MVKLSNNCISFQRNRIQLGYSVALFFLKKGISNVFFEFDYKNQCLIIEGVDPNSAPVNLIKDWENGWRIVTIAPSKKNNWAFVIKTNLFGRIINSLLTIHKQFPAKPIAKNKIIVEGVPFLPMIHSDSGTIYDMINSKVQCRINKPGYLNNFLKDKTLTQDIINKYTNNNQIKRNTHSSTIASRQKDTVNKEIGNPWGFEKPVGKLPSPEQRLEADKANSKMILGE